MSDDELMALVDQYASATANIPVNGIAAALRNRERIASEIQWRRGKADAPTQSLCYDVRMAASDYARASARNQWVLHRGGIESLANIREIEQRLDAAIERLASSRTAQPEPPQ